MAERYNRQFYVLGAEVMKKFQDMLLVGMGGLGVEIAKNLILSGIKELELYDDKVTSWNDLASQFYLDESSVGKNKIDCCISKLRELNPTVNIRKGQNKLDRSYLKEFDTAIFTDSHIHDLKKLNSICRSEGVMFIAAEARGLFGSVFSDFGENFAVHDETGSEPVLVPIFYISNSSTVTLQEAHQLNKITFVGIEGAEELNGVTVECSNIDESTLKIDFDTTAFGQFKSGYVREVKTTAYINHVSLNDFENYNQERFLQKNQDNWIIGIAMKAVALFAKENFLPRSYNKADAEKVLQIAEGIHVSTMGVGMKESQKRLVKLLSYTTRGQTSSVVSLIGGVVAQEAQKSVTGKFCPIDQWYHFNGAACLPMDDAYLPTENDVAPRNCRYDGQIAIFGKNIQDIIMNKRVFMIGAGALGCEYLKILCMMGMGCGDKGKIILTDMDDIQISNLGRQFLYRDWHITQSKSHTAATQAQLLNPVVKIEALNEKIGFETESVFDNDFWNDLDVVMNALDNVEARVYVDSRCRLFHKPLLEAGTQGIIASSQMIVPLITEAYQKPSQVEKPIAMCTLKSFPYHINHTIQWARDLFEGLFTKAPLELNVYIQTGQLENTQQDFRIPRNFNDCVAWGKEQFQVLFYHNIHDLLTIHPPESVTEKGFPFWEGKRIPNPVKFNAQDELHYSFVLSAALLKAQIHRINIEVINFSSEFNSHEKVTRDTPLLLGLEFEKDNDANYHVDFINSASNLRARNYKIPEVDKYTTKRIAGKILPALITTTAAITGVASLELYKLCQDFSDIRQYRCCQLSLAQTYIDCFTSDPPKVEKCFDKEYTIWDQIKVTNNKDLTLKDLIDALQKDDSIVILSITTFDDKIIYHTFSEENKMNTPVSKIIQQVTEKSCHSPTFLKVIAIHSNHTEPTLLPVVRYSFK